MIINGVELSLLGPALCAGLLVVFSHVPLGLEVLKRGIIFIDLAIAQCAALGVIAASLFLPEHSLHEQLLTQVSALGAAGLGALILTQTEKYFPESQEAIIGCSFVLAASAALLLISHNPHGAEHIKDLLAGQILWVNFSDLIPVFLLYVVVVPVWYKAQPHLGKIGFYLTFALIVTASVQLVGVYLVFANLIFPALAARKALNPTRCAYLVGIIGLLMGIILSILLDLPTGPLTVWTLAGIGITTSCYIKRKKKKLAKQQRK